MARRVPYGTSSVWTPYAAPAVESDPEDEGRRLSQPRQMLQIDEARGWISEAEWTINIRPNSKVDSLRLPSDVSIFRVPNFLIESGNKRVYIPNRVSLGPYHHRSAQLPPMHSHKGRALHRMMTRYNMRNHPNDLNNMDFSFLAKQKISQEEDEIRKKYEEKLDCEPENLALMLCFDGCFILEILRTLGGEELPVANEYYEPIFERNKVDFAGFDILNDILMLENQIPLIVLRKLLELELNSVDGVEEKLFKVLVKGPSSKFYPFKYVIREPPWQNTDDQVHLLGLLHTLIVNGANIADQNTPPAVSENDVRRIPPAAELRNVGIKFKKCDGGIKKIKFDRKTIFLPPIRVTDHTEVLFRNLIAFEVCKASHINYVTCYVSLMDELIESEEDVAVLRRSDIVTNYLGSDAQVAELFNGLCQGVTVSRKDDLMHVKQMVNKHYKDKFKVWSAELVKEYFPSPWRSLAVAGAIAALLLTAVQTIFSILSY